MKGSGHDPFCAPDSGSVCIAQSNLSGYGLHHTYDIGQCCKELMLLGKMTKKRVLHIPPAKSQFVGNISYV